MVHLQKSNLLVVNFKTYEEGSGKNALTLAKACMEGTLCKDATMLCLNPYDLRHIADTFPKNVFAQHVDALLPNRNTGWIIPEHAKNAGATGTLINHSEHPLEFKVIKETIERCKKLKLVTIVCAKDATTAEKIAHLSPDYIAYEPPELIAGSVSVTDANPDVITNAVQLVKAVSPSIGVLCGAGIKDGNDAQTAVRLGCKGILVASGVVLAKDPRTATLELSKGLGH